MQRSPMAVVRMMATNINEVNEIMATSKLPFSSHQLSELPLLITSSSLMRDFIFKMTLDIVAIGV